jgi:hypothetical protein
VRNQRQFARPVPQEIRESDRRQFPAIQLLLHGSPIAAKRFVAARRRQPAGL